MEVGLDCAEKLERVFEMVKKNVGKHLQYRVKEYLEDDAKDFQEGTLVLVFLYNKGRVNQARKTTTAWSLPFKIKKKEYHPRYLS